MTGPTETWVQNLTVWVVTSFANLDSMLKPFSGTAA
jgi:hypothetical protein